MPPGPVAGRAPSLFSGTLIDYLVTPASMKGQARLPSRKLRYVQTG